MNGFSSRELVDDRMSYDIGKEEWIKSRYGISTYNYCDGECKQIIACTYREYDAQIGATGGPGGMLHIQEEVLGYRLKGIKIEYLYRESDYRVPENIWTEMLGLTNFTKSVIAGAGYFAGNQFIQDCINEGKNPVMVCHDLGSAYGAFILGLKYMLIYHQQGSIANEIASFGSNLSSFEKQLITDIETKVFNNATKVYFPSRGAQEVFLTTTDAKINLDRLSALPLYNTILVNEHDVMDDNKQVMDILQDIENHDIFISVGDYNYDKGLDRVPDVLARYREICNNNILWIATGNAVSEEIVNIVKKKCSDYGIRNILIEKRIPHQLLMKVLKKANFYIMMHRKAIFDLASLEAMKFGKRIILSNCPANIELNIRENICIVDPENIDSFEFPERSRYAEWEQNNIRVFEEKFSANVFAINYSKAIKNLLIEQGMYCQYDSDVNRSLVEWKDKYRGKSCIICGAGHSLEAIEKQDDNVVYIALNKALFFDRIRFDMLFMQDIPMNQAYKLEDYNGYDCVKFYGIITNPHIASMGLNGNINEFENVKNQIIRYELAPNHYDWRCDDFIVESDIEYIRDAQSVLFSALQIVLMMGFSDVKLCGVDFSEVNYGKVINKSVYAKNVVNNLIMLKREWKIKRPDVNLKFIYSENQTLIDEFKKIDMDY